MYQFLFERKFLFLWNKYPRVQMLGLKSGICLVNKKLPNNIPILLIFMMHELTPASDKHSFPF